MAANISICGVCDLRHLSNLSTHWCQDCDEALCLDCKEHHTLLKATRGHTTIPIDDYQQLPAFITNIKQYCDIHNEKFQNYCQKHECPICCKCIQDHAKCAESILPLETVIENSKTSQIFQDLNQSVSDLQSNITQMRTAREHNLTTLANQCKSGVTKIREFRIKVNNYLDAVEQGLITKLHDAENKCSQQIKEVIKSLNEVELEILNFDSVLQGIKQHASELQVYLATREIGKQVSDKENRLISMMENKHFDNLTVNLEMDTCTKITNILSDVKVFGTVSIEIEPTNYKLINRKLGQAQTMINVKSFDDIQFMQIKKFDSGGRNVTGCTFLQDGRMVFTDYNGGGLLIVKADGKLDFKIPMEGNNTFAVTVVDCTTVAVSSGKPYSNEKACIRITDIQSRGVTKTIYTESWCYGIVFVDDKLVFCGYEPSGIFEIDLKTYTQSVISSTIPLSTWSSISYVEKKFYVTNASTRTITCCDNKGNVLWTYNDDINMKAIRGFSVDINGNAFVASETLKNVTMISHDGKRAKQILDRKDGLDAPYAVQYDRYTNKLLVANQKGMAYLFGEQ